MIYDDDEDRLLLNVGQKYCRMLQGELEHSAILLTFIKLPFAIKIFVLSILSGHLRQILQYFYLSQSYCYKEVALYPSSLISGITILLLLLQEIYKT